MSTFTSIVDSVIKNADIDYPGSSDIYYELRKFQLARVKDAARELMNKAARFENPGMYGDFDDEPADDVEVLEHDYIEALVSCQEAMDGYRYLIDHRKAIVRQ